MDIKQYIASGIIEQYALGLLESPAERQEVERYAAQYPEIRAELLEIEMALEAFAEANAKPLPATMLASLMEAVNTEGSTADAPKTARSNKADGSTPQDATRGGNWLPWVLAVLLGLGLLYALLYGNSSELESLNEDNTELRNVLETLRSDCDATNEALVASERRNQLLTNPSTQSVILAGTPNAPESEAIVFHNVELDRTIFRATNLPAPPPNKQYQLWAIDGDGPQNLGVLATDLSGDALLDVTFVEGAATFAITLEDAGGKPGPDLTQLQVAGNI